MDDDTTSVALALLINKSRERFNFDALSEGRTKECLFIVTFSEPDDIKTFNVFTHKHLEIFTKRLPSITATTARRLFDEGPPSIMWVMGNYAAFDNV